MEMKQRMGKRLVLFPLPLQGHLNPMFQLADILHSKGFSISVIHTHFNAPNPDNHTNFTFHPIADGLLETEASTADVIGLFAALNAKCVSPFRDCLSQMLSDQGEPIAFLITDAFWPFTQAIADGLKLPRIVLRTTNISSFVCFAAFPLLRQKGYLPIQDNRLEEPVAELPPLKVKDIPRVSTADPEVVFEFACRTCNEVKASRGLIFNTFEELEESALSAIRQEFGIPVFPIGPFHKRIPPSSSSILPPDKSCISWLNNQSPNSVLYVSFGSIVAIKEAEFLEIAWGLANSMQPFLWVIRPGLVRGSSSGSGATHPLPDELAEMVAGRAHIVGWAPQLDVLAHPATGGFWTHSGWNSTLESVCEGVPMICLPKFADQMANARYVSDVWKVGIQLENGLGRQNVEKAVRRLMVEKEGEEMRERIACLKEKATLCLAEGGSSHKYLENLASHMLSV
ncbi:hypothetical protein Nepgr_006079 [Nepenthes gracilis]|uniref:Uncharacterized protein n=1 Tax=Nepenthes gracilis TaxID=150966 RepID=A0AAD3S4H7_NEPGR|nr:hypothetical protein Nepgr_006079 [Nepenthes gracilis]